MDRGLGFRERRQRKRGPSAEAGIKRMFARVDNRFLGFSVVIENSEAGTC